MLDEPLNKNRIEMLYIESESSLLNNLKIDQSTRKKAHKIKFVLKIRCNMYLCGGIYHLRRPRTQHAEYMFSQEYNTKWVFEAIFVSRPKTVDLCAK